MIDLPYFDLLLEGRRGADPAALVFERFVHWGFWADPSRADGTAEDYQRAMDRLNDEVVAGARVGDDQTILDAGCGFGGTLLELNKRLDRARLIGVNIDDRQLAAARPALKAKQGNSLDVVCADACALPFPAGSFDSALAVECIFHFPSRLRFLTEVERVLKPGGRLSLSDFVPLSPGARGSLIGRWLERRIGEGYGGLGAGWEDGGYAAIARKAGLILELERDVTRQTLPTYPFLLALIRRQGFGGAHGRMLWPTRLLYWLSACGLLRYRIVVLRKP